MRAKQVHLQFPNLIGSDADIAELSNASSYCVSNAVLAHQVINHLARKLDLLASIGSKQDRPAVVNDRAQICECEMFAVDVKSGQNRLPASSYQLPAKPNRLPFCSQTQVCKLVAGGWQ